MTGWSGPDVVAARLERLWRSGAVLRESVGVPSGRGGASAFPLRISLVRPSSADVADRLADVAGWSRSLVAASTRAGWRLETRRVSAGGSVGAQQVPWFAHVDDVDVALRVLGASARADARTFAAVFAQACGAGGWARDVAVAWPLDALSAARDWPALLAVADWLRRHPRPGIPARMLPVPGMHSKLVESRQRLLGRLLDAALPAEAIDPAASSFAGRYGLAGTARTVTVRAAGPVVGLAHLPVAEVAWPAGGLAGIDPAERGVTAVVVVENYACLAMVPDAPGRVVLCGAGYQAADLLAAVGWLASVPVTYWGDLDSHGFAILDAVRAVLPGVTSTLMDAPTVAAHEGRRTLEPAPHPGGLQRLTAAERAGLLALGPSGRIEQEHLDQAWVAAAFEARSAP
ncbi:MAG: Wadjet anti-phage system protein JetD domain-containing protein [Candidatus Nanopelagicales bacterium]